MLSPSQKRCDSPHCAPSCHLLWFKNIPGGLGGWPPIDRIGPARSETGSIRATACRHRPNGFDDTVPYTDIPVVHVAGRVAMARHQLELVVDLENTVRIHDDAMLVRAFHVLHVIPA